ncbi:TetR/AcrR family transcriptional regulator [Ktedonosporobacter rubrisoli]|nr:TetR/AcrR family transcriptional regulator [Ktedonosporobacter rubrisoli]
MESAYRESSTETNHRDGARRRPGGRSTRIRTAVLQATMSMLRERGLEGLNVAEIAATIGIPESTIYRHWRSREELVVATALAHMDETIQLPDTGSLRSDIQIFLQDSASFLQSTEGQLFTRSMFATMNRTESQVRQEYWMSRFSHTGLLIQRAIERGEVAPETDPNVIMTALIGALYVRLLVLDAPLDAAFLRQLELMLLDGILQKRHL